MSVQYGRCNFDGKPVNPEDIAEVRPVLAPYGPDGEGYLCQNNFAVVYRALHTTKESRCELQPHVLASGAVLTWDGRLDNREQLIEALKPVTRQAATDLELVGTAFECWGAGSFAKLIGDWALSVWEPKDGSLTLAKDFIGTRQIYYSVEKQRLTWCTILDPLVLFANHCFELDEEYIAGWLSSFPAPHVTPYVGICSVPPSSFVRFKKGTKQITKYWDFDPSRRIRYRTDAEYEEHFRTVFATSVRRCVRSDSPILAELSGGMDSSSIVCMADLVIAGGTAGVPRLDTISYYDDSEPNWNERPYFTKVEEKRGRSGCHVNVGSETFCFHQETKRFVATPAAGGPINEIERQFISCLKNGANRVLLSGIGGDEVMGGVPTPLPELADYVADGQFTRLARQLIHWALSQRKPWVFLLGEALRGFLPRWSKTVPRHLRGPGWLERTFARKHAAALRGYLPRTRFFGPLPSFQDNLVALDGIRRQLPCDVLDAQHPYEKRWPYLDRDLLEFIFAIPREQMVRPGQRRSLMRRALVGIVPDELLNRRRKAYVARAQLAAIAAVQDELMQRIPQLFSVARSIVLPDVLAEAVMKAGRGEEAPTISLYRLLSFESWLNNPSLQRFLRDTRSPGVRTNGKKKFSASFKNPISVG
jgi:asparagine synthase (glutamine-hydrolysing)